MKFGIITELEPGPEPWPSEDREAQVYREAAGQAVKAEELGSKWVDPADVPQFNIHPTMRRRIDDALAERDKPTII